MARSALTTVLSVGLSTGVVVLSFFGCYVDLRKDVGSCEAGDAGSADAGPGDCTIPKCNADGTPAPEPVPNAEKRVCFRGENEGMCVDGECALICETEMVPCKCASDSACPDDKVCIDWSCDMAGECKSTLTADGTLIDPLETGDCLKSVCQGGTPKPVPDMDPPADMAGDCKMPACKDGVSDPLPANDPPMDTPKDCLKPACMNGVSMPVPDDMDEPDDTGCVNKSCANGVEVSANSPIGTMCLGGACNAMGVCVDCLSQADWTTCGGTLCKAHKCDGEPCTLGPECKSTACADNFCCNTTCTGECKSCNLANSVGVCTNIAYLGTDPVFTDPVFMTPAVCDDTTTSACNGAGKCLKTIGKMCNANAECLSNSCIMPQKVCQGATGETCTSAGACKSGKCTAGACE